MYTEEQFLLIQKELNWPDNYVSMFKEFVEKHKDFIPAHWPIEDVAFAVAFYDNALDAFWGIEEGQDYADLVTLLAGYDLTDVKEKSLAEHLVAMHYHYYEVSNGYVFFAE